MDSNYFKEKSGSVPNGAGSKTELSGNNANYTCLVQMWWWDGNGNWFFNATVEDNNDIRHEGY